MSSIRRLVSDNKGQSPREKALEASERLVLSPDQRVSGQSVLKLQPQDAVAVPDGPQDADTPPQTEAPSEEAFIASLEEALLDANMPPEGPAPTPVVADSPPGDASDSETRKLDQLTAKIAALETAIAETADQWEPDGSSEDVYAGTDATGMAWQESVELDATGAPLASDSASASAGGPTTGSDGFAEDHVLDEDTLREIVAEVVRAELQGALGERITRNMRKLVRREIHRALAAQELDQ